MIGFIKEMFLDVGILKKHLKVSHVCTVCDHDYFSWVRQRDRGEEKGMNLSVIGLEMV